MERERKNVGKEEKDREREEGWGDERLGGKKGEKI